MYLSLWELVFTGLVSFSSFGRLSLTLVSFGSDARISNESVSLSKTTYAVPNKLLFVRPQY